MTAMIAAERLTETEAGTAMLEALDAYRHGNIAATKIAARRARHLSPDAFTARYADALVYDLISNASVQTAEGDVRRFLIAADDSRYRAFEPSRVVPAVEHQP